MDPAWFAAASPTADPVLDWFTRGGSIAILTGLVYAFIKGWIVPKAEVDRLVGEIAQLRTERDRALDLVYASAGTTEEALRTLVESKEKWSHLDP